MDEVQKAESHLTSAAAFVEGGIQEADDDACSICLEAFCNSDPSTVTSCKHEFHLQCILEWCQRSSNCPMCWQSISLKDPASQELLEGVERERTIRLTPPPPPPPRNATIFHHPTLGDFELQHLPVGMNDPELEDRIIQHLAAAAAMGRTHRMARRERSRNHSRPQFVVFSRHRNAASNGSGSDSLPEIEPDATSGTNSSFPNERYEHLSPSVHGNQSASVFASIVTPNTRQEISNDNRIHASNSSLQNQDRAGPSEFQSFSDTWRSRLNAISMKYKESISRNTRGWKEKLFSGSCSTADIGLREVNTGMATVSRMMEHIETRENNRAGPGRVMIPNDRMDSSRTERRNHENSRE